MRMAPSILVLVVAGAAAGGTAVSVEQGAGRVLLRTSVGSFETRQPDLPPELIEAVLGGPGASVVYAGK